MKPPSSLPLPATRTGPARLLVLFLSTVLLKSVTPFQILTPLSHASAVFHPHRTASAPSPLHATEKEEPSPPKDETSEIRFPTGVDDQVRQAAAAIRAAGLAGIHRHSVRLLLPLIGATELDDWPGGSRQMTLAALPLMRSVVSQLGSGFPLVRPEMSESVLDESDGTVALFSREEDPKEDSCSVLLPSGDAADKLRELDAQVGPERNLIVANAQWKRDSDFSWFGRKELARFAETFVPTYSVTNSMVEGDQIRVLRAFPGDWRVYQMETGDDGVLDWVFIGSKAVTESGSEGGGYLFDFGKPTYREIESMISSREGYVPKSVQERAAASLIFIKDTL